MALITRLQWMLLRLGLTQTWTQIFFVAAVLLAVLVVMLRQDGMNALAKVSGSSPLPSLLGAQTTTDWNTVYELDSVAAQAHANTEALLRTSNPRQANTHKALNQVQSQPQTSMLENGEALFLKVYHLQSEGQYAQALQVAQNMVDRYPNFQLGQLVYADLLASMSASVPERESLLNNPEAQQRLSQLKTEALQRTQHASRPPLAGQYPEPLRYLSPSVPQVVVVDAQKSRLYLLANRAEGQGIGQMQVVFDAYVSIGSKGMGKWREGDAKTPVGVYFVQKHMTDPMLPDLYGSGALTLDYPSPLDKQQQRTGSGIWLHGSPSQQYARPPTATDGCVVLANDDMLRLVQHGVRAGTPVIIADQLNWRDATKVPAPKAQDALSITWPQPQHTMQNPGLWKLVSAFEWSDQQQTMAVLSHEREAPGHAPQRRHSYWVNEQQQWKEVGVAL